MRGFVLITAAIAVATCLIYFSSNLNPKRRDPMRRFIQALLLSPFIAMLCLIVVCVGSFVAGGLWDLYSVNPNYDTLIDERDGKKYRTVKMPDGRIWLAQNLNYQPQAGDSWCYNDNNSNCGMYGRLYDFHTAKTVCPAGWHLPSHQEWDDLLTAAGGRYAATELKTSFPFGKDSDYYATNYYGFSAMSGGVRDADGSFNSAGDCGFWWTATERSDSLAYNRFMKYYDISVGEGYGSKSDGYSVRCVADSP